MEKDISQAVISRLPRYFRYLGDLKERGVERISSQELSDIMKVTASQIRQDFNNFGGFGQQGYGYNVEYLYDEIGKILGLDKQHSLVIIGDEDAYVGIISNGFHEYRAMSIARNVGYNNVHSVPAVTLFPVGIHYTVREFFGMVEFYVNVVKNTSHLRM